MWITAVCLNNLKRQELLSNALHLLHPLLLSVTAQIYYWEKIIIIKTMANKIKTNFHPKGLLGNFALYPLPKKYDIYSFYPKNYGIYQRVLWGQGRGFRKKLDG